MSNTADILKTLYEGDTKETDKYVRDTISEFASAVKDSISDKSLQEELVKESIMNGNNLMASFYFMLKPQYVPFVNNHVGLILPIMDMLSKKIGIEK